MSPFLPPHKTHSGRHGRHIHPSLLGQWFLGCLTILLCALWYALTPTFSDISYVPTITPSPEDIPVTDVQFPISFESYSSGLKVSFNLQISPVLHPNIFTIRADDCLTELIINDQPVPETFFGACVIDRPNNVAFGNFLHPGSNRIQATAPDTGGRQGFSMNVSRTDPLMLILRLALGAALLSFLLLVGWQHTRSRDGRFALILIIIGIALRLAYFDATSYNIRSNDAEGHVDYIRYVADHWTLPPIHDGWEFYQPPLYYFATAPVYAGLRALDMPQLFIFRSIQFLSVIASVLILALGAWMATLLFDARQRTERLLWIGIFAVFPGLLLLSSKISNDTLVQLLIFTGAAMTLRFWQTGNRWIWYMLMVIISAGILTKMNALVLEPMGFGALILHPSLTQRRKAIMGIIGACIILWCTEGLVVVRMLQDPNAGVVGNVDNLHEGLMVTTSFLEYLRFNPMQVLQHPYNNAWEDSYRRQFFLEYFIRSAFFGEWDFGSLFRRISQVLLATSMVLGMISLGGFITGLRQTWRRALPLWILFIAILVIHLALRVRYPYAPSQDFRYSVVILVPTMYFLFITLPFLPLALRRVVVAVVAFFIVLCGVFVIALSIVNPL